MKEIVLAIILGSLLGLGLTGSYYFLTTKNDLSVKPITTLNDQTRLPSTASPSQETVQPSVHPDTDTEVSNNLSSSTTISLTISSPVNESITDSSKTTIKGETAANAYIIASTATKSFYTQANSTGSFSLTIDLESGANLVRIDSIIETGNSQTSTDLLITYSTAKI